MGKNTVPPTRSELKPGSFKLVKFGRQISRPRFQHVPWSKVAILGMVIPPLIGIVIMGM